MQWNNKTLDCVALRAGISRIGCESIRKGSSPVPYVKHSVRGANAVDEDPACLSALVNDVSRWTIQSTLCKTDSMVRCDPIAKLEYCMSCFFFFLCICMFFHQEKVI